MLYLVVGLVLFLGFHSIRIILPEWRTQMIAKLGRAGWGALHSIVSLATLAVLVYGFGDARLDTSVLWYPPLWTRHLVFLLMLPAMICLFAAALPAGYIRSKLKFPLTVAVKIWACAHLLANGEVSSILLFGAFLLWAVALRISLKKAVARGELALPAFVSARYDALAVAGGVVLWAYNSKRKSSFDEAANLPFADDIPANKRDEQASGSNKE